MWETEGLGPEDVLWASTAFNGGIAGKQQAVCGAVSSGTVCLGLRHRTAGDAEEADAARQAARSDAALLAGGFAGEFGSLICIELIEVAFTQPGAREYFRESGIMEKRCLNYVKWVVRRLYELGGG